MAAPGREIDLSLESINSTLVHHFTAHHGNFEITRMLVEEYGLDPLQSDAQGDNLAHQAVACQNPERFMDVMQLLK